MTPGVVDSMEQQLRALYEEREFLESKFGVSSSEDIVNMVSNLEAQLHDFYNRFGHIEGFDDANTLVMLEQLEKLSKSLDPMYSCKSVEFFVENDKPVLRAVWNEHGPKGDD